MTPGATAIANIGWRYFLVFACLTVVTIVVLSMSHSYMLQRAQIWDSRLTDGLVFFYPETKGKSLEELVSYPFL